MRIAFRSSISTALAAAASFFVIASISIAMSRAHSDFALLWLANIATVGFCLHRTVWTQALIIAASFAAGATANMIAGSKVVPAVAFMTANMVEVGAAIFIVQWLLRRSNPRLNPMHFTRLVVTAAALPPIISSFTANGLLVIAGIQRDPGFLTSWWIADAAGTATVLPTIILFPSWKASEISVSETLSNLFFFAAAILMTILSVWYISYPFVYVGLAMMLVAIRCRPLWTAICAALVVMTITICAFENVFSFADGPGAIGNVLHLHAVVAVLPAIVLSLVLDNLRLEKEKAFEAADQFRRVMEDSAVGMALVTGSGGITKVNRAFAEMLGYSAQELEMLRVADITHDDDLRLGADTFAKIASGQLDRFRFEKRYKRKDGSTFWALLAGSVIRSPDKGYYTISQVEDIDASKRYQAALEAMEERWQLAFSAAKQGVWDANLATGKTYYSPTWCSILGYDCAEVGDDGGRWLDLMHPDDRKEALALNQNQIAGKSADFEARFRMRHKDGRWIWILDRGLVIERSAEGKALRMVGTHTDITHQKEIEEEVLLLSERTKLAVQAGEVGLWHWDPQADKLWWDERMHALYGTDPATFAATSDSWSDRVHPDDLPEATELLNRVIQGDAKFDGEFRIITPEGKVRHIRALALLSRSEKGDPKMLIGTNWDITVQKQLVEQLSQANMRLKEFASFASHDLQAPLRHIRMQTELLAAELRHGQNPELGKFVTAIASKSGYLQELIKNLLTLAKAADDIAAEPISLVPVIEDAIETVLPELRQSGGRIDYGELPDVVGDEILLRQVFQNLFANAIKYRSSASPRISISVERSEIDTIVSVADNGIGVEAK